MAQQGLMLCQTACYAHISKLPFIHTLTLSGASSYLTKKDLEAWRAEEKAT